MGYRSRLTSEAFGAILRGFDAVVPCTRNLVREIFFCLRKLLLHVAAVLSGERALRLPYLLSTLGRSVDRVLEAKKWQLRAPGAACRPAKTRLFG